MLASIVMLIFTNPSELASGMSEAATSAVELSINLVAVYAVWLGVLEIVDKSGLGAKLAKLLHPIIKKLFKIDDEETEKMIALNISANMLGLGNAATPMGTKAMKRICQDKTAIPSAGIMLLILNATCIQLLPTTVIGMRAASGSTNPSDIILPTFLASLTTTIVGVSLVLLIEKFRKKKV